ncbi:AGE family epimerase/isomerase [Halomonas sp. M4R5S39]|uniref:AGE family epimerase/isomerase n=1 Tax=Halomonas kalidii TaxID=3043293 RepID=UPI0024A94AEE|nr:AGE family epimerase/isomerase [Halomonas kalidii]MDI5986950.1 AGE family epimerase/isomerase [Halomonas kalidii]
MNVYDIAFLEAHIRKTMGFYHPRAIDPEGGFFHYLRDDGTIYDRRHRHLVSSARYVFTYAHFAAYFQAPDYLAWARHGLRYLEERHFQPDYQGYAWTLRDGRVEDDTNHCYGLAFVLLAHATALKAGIDEAREGLYRVHELQTRRFWEPRWRRYADEADRYWQVSDYRGQNANMHSCEALIAAFDATGDAQFLERAGQVAAAICLGQAERGRGWIWEHYDRHWRLDLDYHRDDPKHLFRPWGYQVGHQTEWAKLLLMLERRRPAPWLLPRARELFLGSVEAGWHPEHGGLVYGLDLDGAIFDGDKYFWVQAESLAAAAMLGSRTGERRFWRWYERLWDFSWRHMIDHEHGAWYRILTPDNRRYSDEKSPAGKVDYHTMGACYDAIEALRRGNVSPS